MSAPESHADWRLPAGVDRALWDYIGSRRLAEEEDAYFATDALCRLDLEIVAEHFTQSGWLIDLGCGAGRASLAFAARGFEVVSVDLSQEMLNRVAASARARSLRVHPLRANMCDLRALADASFAYALLLFSTLGMIRGRTNRRAALSEVARVVRPGGMLALHAHHVLANRHDPHGRRWLLGDTLRHVAGRPDAGDRPMTYRGIPNLVVHQYRWFELVDDLRAGGWRVDQCMALNARKGTVFRRDRGLSRLLADGWLIFATRGAKGPRETRS